MLPFLKKNVNNAGVIMKTRAPDAHAEEHSDTSDLEACAEDLCYAIDRKDYRAIAESFKAMFELCELEPHDEAEHEPHSYDAQNALAAKGQE